MGSPQNERSLAVDRQRGARCFIVSSLLAIPPALCTRIWLSSPRHGLQITEGVARQRGTMLNLAFIVNGHGTGHPHCDGNTRNVKKKNYIRLEGTRHLRLEKKEIKKGNPSAFQCVILWQRICDESVSGSPRKRRRLYRIKRPTEFQSKSSLDKFESIIPRSRKRGFMAWEFNYESGSCEFEIVPIRKADDQQRCLKQDFRNSSSLSPQIVEKSLQLISKSHQGTDGQSLTRVY